MRRVRHWCSAGLMAVWLTGMASGLPLLLSGSTLQAWLLQAHHGVWLTGSVSLLGLPYLFKFIWAPCFDIGSCGRLGRRRMWLLVWQLAIAMVLWWMSCLDPRTQSAGLLGLAFLLAWCSASHDCVVDAYRVDRLSRLDQGYGAALTFFGYRLGMLLSGGVALIVADQVGFVWVFRLLAVIMVLFAVYSACLTEPASVTAAAPVSLATKVVQPYQEWVNRPGVVMSALFMLLYKLPDHVVSSMNMPFLYQHLHFSLSQIGAINKTVSILGLTLGSFVAGAALTRMSTHRALQWFGWLQLFSNMGYVVLAWVGKSMSIMVMTFFIENFCGGMATAAFVCYLTQQCDRRYSAGQYALFSAIMGLPRVLLGPLAAAMVAQWGWFVFYLWTVLLGLPAMALLYGRWRIFPVTISTGK